MGIFNKVKDLYIQSEEKRLVTLVNAEYVGGDANYKKALGNLSFFPHEVSFKVAINNRRSFNIKIEDISKIIIEGRDDVSRRITVTRLVALGVFALALQKKEQDKDAFVTLELLDGREIIFHIKEKSPMEVRLIVSKTNFAINQMKHS